LRPRERYLASTDHDLGEADLLALVLGTGVAGRSALELAAGALAEHGDLTGLARTSPQELAQLDGFGLARAVRVHAALGLARRLHRSPRPPPTAVIDAATAFAQLGPPLRGLVDEELHGLFLDRRRRPIARRVLTRGNDATTIVDPRQIFREGVRVGASAVILAHNHPSGDPTPSRQDVDVTRRVARAGELLGLPLLDHLVVGALDFVSMAEQGLVPTPATARSWTV